MKINEKLRIYNALVEEIKKLQEESDIEKLEAKLNEAETLKKEIEVLNKAREFELKEILDSNSKVNETVYNQNVLKRILRNKATSEDLRIYNSYVGQKESVLSDGGYLVPEEQLEELYEYKRTLNDLSQYVNVIGVTSPKGSIPLEVLSNDKLTDITEGQTIDISKAQFGQMKWETHDYGDMMSVTNQLLDDSGFDLMGYLKTRIGKKSVNTINSKIIEIIKNLENPLTATKTTGLDVLNEAIIKHLDPTFRYDGIILTNQTGRLYLETLTDKQGRPLLLDSYTNQGVKQFKGLTLVEVADGLLPTEENVALFAVGDMKSLITKFDLKGLELATSKEAGFTNNTTLLRAIERFDIKVLDKDAMKLVKITVK